MERSWSVGCRCLFGGLVEIAVGMMMSEVGREASSG